jgi:purine-cytosine permease-like protein
MKARLPPEAYANVVSVSTKSDDLTRPSFIAGNLVGCAFFGLFCVMGPSHRLNQMVLSGAAFGHGLNDFLHGPIAEATHNVDISWLSGFAVSAGLYYVLRPLLVRETAPAVQPTL